MHSSNFQQCDCFDGMASLKDNSVHLVLTDPPYFIDGLDDKWNVSKLKEKADKGLVVQGLPVGMKFDTEQSKKFQAFMSKVSKEAFRVLKPGGFFISFSQARLYHRLAVAAEDAGFEIRDMLGWVYEGQAKAFSQDHFVFKNDKYLQSEKNQIIAKLNGRKTPQLKPQIEPMILAQKPKDGTFVDNWLKYETGLIDTTASLDGKFPGNLMVVDKPSKLEKLHINNHMTVKPVKLMEHLIQLFSTPGQTVLDPFLGSGTTLVAAKNLSRNGIGFEKEPQHYKICQERLK